MKVTNNRFQGGTDGAEGAGSEITTGEARAAGYSQVDGAWHESAVSLAQFSGAVSSRESYGYYRIWTPPAPPPPNHVQAEAEVGLECILLGLQDQRIPKMNISVNGNTISVDGLSMSFEKSARGISVHAVGQGLQFATVERALHKLMSLGLAARTLEFLDKNPNNMADVRIIEMPDGRLQVKAMAKVRINPRLEKQGQFVLDQLDGGHTMPERTRAAVAERNRRTQVIG